MNTAIVSTKCQRCGRERGPVFGKAALQQCNRCRKLVCHRCTAVSVPVGKIAVCKDCAGASLPRL